MDETGGLKGGHRMEFNLEGFKQSCSCGREHLIEVEKIVIQSGVLSEVSTFIKSSDSTSYPIIICDLNTYGKGASQLEIELNLKSQQVIVLNPCHLHADEYALEAIYKQLESKVSVLIAVGSGTIHDLTRYLAHYLNIPFISVPTAASVDGFASSVAAMTFKGFKVTTSAKAPLAIFADTNIISKAPTHLTAAGVADLLAKYTALLDWKVAHVLTHEYLCERIIKVTEEALQMMLESLDGIANKEEEAYESLMYGLIISGLGMQMIGNSRPASGAEHHLSHLWEMHVINDEIEALHGEKVGVGLLLVSEAYHALLDWDQVVIQDQNLLDEMQLMPYFKQLTPHILKENQGGMLDDLSEEKFMACLDEIKVLIKELPSPDELRSWILKVSGKTTLTELGLSESLKEMSLSMAPYVRNRLTLLRVMKKFKLNEEGKVV